MKTFNTSARITDIDIAGQEYSVVYADPSACALADVRGWCDNDNQTIYLDPSANARVLRDTLWHEIIHGLFREHGFPEKQGEEETCTFLGCALEAFCRANRAFVIKHLL